MDIKEIKEIVSEIPSDIEKNKNSLTYRKYETFFGRLGMPKRRDPSILEKVDRQLKKHNITLWVRGELVKKTKSVEKGYAITFRCEENEARVREVESPHAGVVGIENSESQIELYQHQKKAFSSLQSSIIKSNKDSFSGLLVLPTGGGKTAYCN
ncbi:MAG: hypothetical protein LBG47_06035 [Prevotellaceae bacterium]|jgi:hypothetical protein|nr:hypothetical protein [Prevotellaceae bacterium]